MNAQPLRIAHVSATFPPYYGGTGTVCYHNARVLAARGHDVHVYTAAWPGRVDDPPGVTVHRLRPLARVGNAPVLPQLARLPADAIVHLHFPFYAGAEFVALARRPYVVTYHQDVELGGWMGRASRAHDRVVGRRVLRGAARLCPTSLDYFRSSVFADLVPALGERVVPIPNGVDAATFRPGPADEAILRRYRVPPLPVVLFVGSMDRAHYFKGIPTLLRALAQLPEVAGLLVGDGDLRPEYERLAAELGLAGRVRFAGRVEAGDLPQLYRAADVFVLPSETRGEAFGIVLLEAMASGCPVIAADLPGVRSVVAPEVDGLLVPPKDPAALAAKIAHVLALEPSARRAMGAAGRRKVEAEYSWERVGDRLESLYRSVATESKIPPPLVRDPNRPHAVRLPIEVRVAMDAIARTSGGTDGAIRGRLLGSPLLGDELRRYAPLDRSASSLIALAAPAEQVAASLGEDSPAEVVTLVAGPLHRVLRPLRAGGDAQIPMTSDLSRAAWTAFGYAPVAAIGVQGVGSIAWALAERVLRRVGRPDLADRCRIGMLRSLIVTNPISPATMRVRRYRCGVER